MHSNRAEPPVVAGLHVRKGPLVADVVKINFSFLDNVY